MQNTFYEFRNLPGYPIIVTRAVGLYHTIYALASFFIGYVLLSGDVSRILTTSLALLGLASGRVMDINTLLTFMRFLGGWSVFMGFLSAWVAFGIFMQRPAIWRQTIVLNIFWLVNWLLGGKSLLVLMLILCAVITVILFMFDERVKALFERGKLAKAYWEWKLAKAKGEVTTSPWGQPAVPEVKPQ